MQPSYNSRLLNTTYDIRLTTAFIFVLFHVQVPYTIKAQTQACRHHINMDNKLLILDL